MRDGLVALEGSPSDLSHENFAVAPARENRS